MGRALSGREAGLPAAVPFFLLLKEAVQCREKAVISSSAKFIRTGTETGDGRSGWGPIGCPGIRLATTRYDGTFVLAFATYLNPDQVLYVAATPLKSRRRLHT